MLDLKKANISDYDILNFNNLLDELAKSVKEENKQKSITNLANLYSYLPKFFSKYSNDKVKQSVYSIKSNLIFAYSMVDMDNKWVEMNDKVINANNEFDKLLKIDNINKNKTLNINRVNLLLKEIRK